MPARTGREYLDGLKAQTKEIHIRGQRVDDVHVAGRGPIELGAEAETVAEPHGVRDDARGFADHVLSRAKRQVQIGPELDAFL